jgi:hypothetical protein
MSLRGKPVVEQAVLADGRALTVRVAVPEDPYVSKRELDTVGVELLAGDEVLASLTSTLSPEQTSEARRLALEIKHGLESGRLEPRAGAIEPIVGKAGE